MIALNFLFVKKTISLSASMSILINQQAKIHYNGEERFFYQLVFFSGEPHLMRQTFCVNCFSAEIILIRYNPEAAVFPSST